MGGVGLVSAFDFGCAFDAVVQKVILRSKRNQISIY